MLPPARKPEDPRRAPLWLRRELLAQGWNDREIRRSLSSGDITRVRHGAYVAGSDWAKLDRAGQYVLRGRAVVRQASAPSVLSHLSAAAEYEAPLWGVDLTRVHVTRTDGLSGRIAKDVCQHEALLRPESLVVIDNRLVTTPARAVLETVTCASAEAALCVANYMLHEGLTTIEELRDEYVGMESWPHTRRAEVVLRLADPRLESVGESRLLWACFLAGLPKPVPQFEVRDGTGRVIARLDFAWPELGVFLEFDGRVKYEALLRDGERASDVVIRERDRERLICRITGWTCVRAVWADLDQPARLIAELVEAFAFRRSA